MLASQGVCRDLRAPASPHCCSSLDLEAVSKSTGTIFELPFPSQPVWPCLSRKEPFWGCDVCSSPVKPLSYCIRHPTISAPDHGPCRNKTSLLNVQSRTL